MHVKKNLHPHGACCYLLFGDLVIKITRNDDIAIIIHDQLGLSATPEQTACQFGLLFMGTFIADKYFLSTLLRPELN